MKVAKLHLFLAAGFLDKIILYGMDKAILKIASL